MYFRWDSPRRFGQFVFQDLAGRTGGQRREHDDLGGSISLALSASAAKGRPFSLAIIARSPARTPRHCIVDAALMGPRSLFID
jgi:hypothetical protein